MAYRNPVLFFHFHCLFFVPHNQNYLRNAWQMGITARGDASLGWCVVVELNQATLRLRCTLYSAISYASKCVSASRFAPA